VKVSILGPEYLEDQFHGGPTHEPRRGSHATHQEQQQQHHDPTKVERETALAQNFEHSADASSTPPPHPDRPFPPTHHNHQHPITPSEALRLRHQHLHSISVLASQFGAKLVDLSENSVIVEMCGKTSRVEAFLSLVKPFGVLESARTGMFFFLWIVCNADVIK
jgi:acetolactate synthase-1/3 small subunit